MKRTIRLNESELKRMISESVRRVLNEGVHRYKGFKCVNVSDDPSFPSYAIISPEGETIDNTLFPSEMKEIVDNFLKGRNSSAGMDYLSEGKLHSIVSKSLRRVLREWSDDYEGNDLDYETIKMEAEDAIFKMQQQGQIINWRNVAENMGFRLETLNGDDMELLKDTIEEVMMENNS